MYTFQSRRRAEAKKKADPAAEDPSKQRLKKPTVEGCIICFKPNLSEYTFEGSEIFKMSTTDPAGTKEIVLNAVDLTVTKAVWEEDETLERREPRELREDKGIFKLIFEPGIPPQTGQLRMNFHGFMSEKKLSGLYAYDPEPTSKKEKDEAPSEDEDGRPLHVDVKPLNVMTFFGPCEARRCFPCWDDPAVKMTYDLIVVMPKGSVAIGPTPVRATYGHRKDPTLEVAEFKTTPKLSPHCIGLTYGSFDYLEGRTSDDEIQIRIYTPKGLKELGEFALSLTCKAIPFFTGYFGVALKTQKIDLVAVPDYLNVPVSNWGIIFFRSSDLLVEPQTAVLDLMWISLIICDEITKQWFDGVTTFDWWSHQWLKEGVAAFAKYIFVHQLFPEMEVWTHFVTNCYHRAMYLDAVHVSRPVEVTVITIPEIEEAVDEICLCKAPSLLRMMHRFVGDAPFRKGLQAYLTQYEYGNATTNDFLRCMQDATSKPITTIMTPWVHVRGYPILTVTSKQEGRTKILKMTQDRFYYEITHRDVKGQGHLWSIPLAFSTRNRPLESVLDIVMDSKVLTVSIPDVGKSDWVKVNPGSVGFFRVRYPHEMMSTIMYAVREKSLPPLDRINILDDSFAFLLAGYSTTVELLSLLEAFVEEDDYAVWVTISNIFDKCIRVFDHVGQAESFQHFGRFLYQQIYAKLGWYGYEDESIQKKLLRPLVIRMMAKFNHVEVVEHCRMLFDASFAKEPIPVPVDFRYAVYKTVVQYGDDTVLRRFTRMYRECESAEEKDKLAYAIGAGRIAPLLAYALDFCTSEDVRRAHSAIIISTVAKSKAGKELAWNFVKDNLLFFKTNFAPSTAGKLLLNILEDFTSEERITEITEFFRANVFPGTEKTLLKIQDAIKINEGWLKREKNLSALQDYLESMN